MTDIDTGIDGAGNLNDPDVWLKSNPGAPKWLRDMVEVFSASTPGPPEVATGRNGRWVKLGDVGVDGAAMGISDPSFIHPGHHPMPSGADTAARWGSGVMFWAGFGDGGYDVWAWIADYGEDGEVDERIAQVVVTLIDGDDLAEWRSMP